MAVGGIKFDKQSYTEGELACYWYDLYDAASAYVDIKNVATDEFLYRWGPLSEGTHYTCGYISFKGLSSVKAVLLADIPGGRQYLGQAFLYKMADVPVEPTEPTKCSLTVKDIGNGRSEVKVEGWLLPASPWTGNTTRTWTDLDIDKWVKISPHDAFDYIQLFVGGVDQGKWQGTPPFGFTLRDNSEVRVYYKTPTDEPTPATPKYSLTVKTIGPGSANVSVEGWWWREYVPDNQSKTWYSQSGWYKVIPKPSSGGTFDYIQLIVNGVDQGKWQGTPPFSGTLYGVTKVEVYFKANEETGDSPTGQPTDVGSVEFRTTPLGVSVYVNGQYRTATSNNPVDNTVKNLSIGSHTYSLSKTGYYQKTGSFNITKDKTTTVTVALTPVTGVDEPTGECTPGEKKYKPCSDGTKIVSHICGFDNKWKETQEKCEEELPWIPIVVIVAGIGIVGFILYKKRGG